MRYGFRVRRGGQDRLHQLLRDRRGDGTAEAVCLVLDDDRAGDDRVSAGAKKMNQAS